MTNKLSEDFRQFKKEIIPLLPEDKNVRILEIGCGYGSLLLLLQEFGYHNAEGIDISPEQVKTAGELGAKNVKLADIHKFLDNANQKYDVLIGIDIIEHFTKNELVELLEKVKNNLTENGCAIFRTPNADAPFGSVYAFGDFTHEIILNYSSSEQVFLSAGFEDVQVLPSHVETNGFFKNIIRKIYWFFIQIECRIILFSTGRSTKSVLLTPNLIIRAVAKNQD